jgi:hypothetical protein
VLLNTKLTLTTSPFFTKPKDCFVLLNLIFACAVAHKVAKIKRLKQKALCHAGKGLLIL